MENSLELSDGTRVTVRPMRPDDVERSLAFFAGLSDEDRVFLRTDVSRRESVERRIRSMESGRVRRLVALDGDAIVADGVLELSGHQWEEHVGEIRLIVARTYRRKGLGMQMARELFTQASAANLEEIVVRMMRPQIAARSIFRKLGFRTELVLPDYVRDRSGRKQDMVVMRCNLEDLWREYEAFVARSDWQRTR